MNRMCDIMVNISKMSKEEYVKYMISLVEENYVKETWEQFKITYKKKYDQNPEFWRDFMELDNADFSDLQILASLDKNFEMFVVNDPTILNEEVSDKIRKKTTGKIPDHVQIEIDGVTGSGKSTFMRTIGIDFFNNFNVNDIFFLKKNLLDYVSSNPEVSYKSCKVLDEDVISRGVGSVRVEEDLSQLFESCRKAELSFIGCHAIKKHDNQTTFYRFFVFAKNTRRRLTCASVFRMNVCIGFLLWRIPYSEKFFELEYEYEKKKDAFIDATMKNENIETLDITKCAEKVLNSPEILVLRKFGKVNKKILKLKVYELFNNYTIGEQDLILTKANIIILSEAVGENPDAFFEEVEKDDKTKTTKQISHQTNSV